MNKSISINKLILILIGFVVVIIVGIMITSDPQEPSSQSVQQEIVQKVSTENLIAAFDSNQLAAESATVGRLIEFTARIRNISENIFGTPFLSLEPVTTDKYYFGTTIKCDFKEKAKILSLTNGQTITLQGRMNNQSLGIILVKECKIIFDS